MSSRVQLVELTTKIGSGSTPRGGKKSYLANGLYKLIRSQNIYNHYFSEDGLAYISEEQAHKLNNVELMKDDILINITGDSVARATIVTEKMLPARVNQHVSIIRCNNEKIYPHYLLSVLTSKEMQRHLLSLAQVGGTRAALTKGMLEKLEIDIVGMKKQRYIGDVLRFINTKIETNQNVIQLLEKISQALFKSWFYDFEFPNEEGLPYKSSGGKMVDSQLGDIPEGWNLYVLSEITQISKKTFNPQKTDAKVVAHFSLPAYDSKCYPILDEVKTIKSNKWIVNENCVLFSKMNPSTPRVWLPILDKSRLNVCSSEFVVLKSENDSKAAFIYNLCKSEPFTEYLIAGATGSTNSRQRITPDNAMLFKIALNGELIDKYGLVVKDLMEKVKILSKENHQLEKVRDTLLPKLLSGGIEIPDESVVV
ncbi:type I restriction enzyme S subunit [Cytobacillus firmus]|uniref:Type I restriction enzyme S subunit n=2 Tax=Cytobacillus TaxID=2675230 RepID=A0A366JNV4_CYTFI|nr:MULTISPECIES: restriction endonuclease subunit S [Cytobacillus]RBP89590.1 type I restriction enzyme S subunit [Cytobacillus firmus]TDX47183.1 type I restriction enzyme S subunit [Cytobacillus oceanisediminis]